jgi:hypothetical protein
MAGTATAFDKTKTLWNNGQVWIDLAVPSAGGKITLATDGTPDATANPSAKHIGFTRKGSKVSYKMTKTDAMDDEHTAPHDTRITAEAMRIEGTFLQVLDTVLLAEMSVGGTEVTVTSDKVVTFGGQQSITTRCIAVIVPKKDAPTKFIAVVLYAAYNESGIEITITKDAENESPFAFVANAVAGRAALDQLGQILVQT